LTFYYFAVLNVDYYKTGLLDLGWWDLSQYFSETKAMTKDGYPSLKFSYQKLPSTYWSDPSQYFAQAKAMMKGKYPCLNFGFQKLPSTYPPGYPALMLPWLKVLPDADSILAPFRTNQTIGFLLLLATFVFYVYLGMPLTGGFAALLLATLPGFFTFCRSSLSEIDASTLIALAYMFAYLGLKEERRWKIYLSAIFLGLSLNIRLQSLFFAPLLLAMALFPSQAKRLRWFLHCFAVLIVFALAASPSLVLNTIQFHSPFKTGYDYWLAGDWPVRRSAIFSPGHIPKNAVALWRELTLHPRTWLPARYFGTGASFVPPFVLLACVGAFFIPLNRFVLCAFLAGLSCYAFTSSIIPEWADTRYYLPLLMLLIAVVVLPVTWAAENLLVPRRAVASWAIFVFFAAACLGYPSRSLSNTPQVARLGRETEGNRFQAWDAFYFPTPPLESPWLTAERHFLKTFAAQPGIVLADINPLFLNALLPDAFVAVPLDGERYAEFKNIVTYDRAQAVALVKRGLDQSRPIYALFVSQKEMDEKSGRLPEVDGYKWIVAENTPEKAVILKLDPR
jgi:hypothetical protein